MSGDELLGQNDDLAAPDDPSSASAIQTRIAEIREDAPYHSSPRGQREMSQLYQRLHPGDEAVATPVVSPERAADEIVEAKIQELWRVPPAQRGPRWKAEMEFSYRTLHNELSRDDAAKMLTFSRLPPGPRSDGAPTLDDVLQAVPAPDGGWHQYKQDLGTFMVAPMNRYASDPQEAAGVSFSAITILRRLGAFSPGGPVAPPAPGAADARLQQQWGEAFENQLQVGAAFLRDLYPDPATRQRVVQWLERCGAFDDVDFCNLLIRTGERRGARR